MKSAACLRYGIKAKPCMESTRSVECNQSEGEIHADACCHTVALRRIPCTLRVIPYQSFGLDRKKQVFRLAFFLSVSNNFEPYIFKTFISKSHKLSEEYRLHCTATGIFDHRELQSVQRSHPQTDEDTPYLSQVSSNVRGCGFSESW